MMSSATVSPIPSAVPAEMKKDFLPLETVTSLLLKKFKDVYGSDGERAPSFTVAFFDFPKQNTPARWAYHFLSGRFILAPLKNLLKFYAEFIPGAIGTLAFRAINNIAESYNQSLEEKNKLKSAALKIFAGISFPVAAAIYAVARTTELITSRVMSPMRSFREAWRIHPALGIVSGLFTIVATGTLAFWTAPFIMLHLIALGSPTITLSVSRLAMACFIIAAPLATKIGSAYLINNLLPLGAAMIMGFLAAVVSPIKFAATKIFNKIFPKPPQLTPLVSENDEVKKQLDTDRRLSNSISVEPPNSVSVRAINTTLSNRRESESAINDAEETYIQEKMQYRRFLPTIAQVKDELLENENRHFDHPAFSYVSDHLPQLAEIPLASTKLKVINWRLLNFATQNGFNTKGCEDMINQVNHLVQQTLGKMIAQHQPDFIFLQNVNDSIRNNILATMANHGYMFEMNDRGLITIYNFSTMRFKQTLQITEIFYPGFADYTQRLQFTVLSDNSNLITNNVRLPVLDIVGPAQRFIEYLSTDDKNASGIVAGDFGVSYAPTGNTSFIVNSVATDIQHPEVQKPGYTDGVFYAVGDSLIHQPETLDALNPFDGQALTPVFYQHHPSFALPELLEQRPVLNPGKDNFMDKMLHPSTSMYFIQSQIQVGLHVNAYGRKTVGFTFNSTDTSLAKALIVETYHTLSPTLLYKNHRHTKDTDFYAMPVDFLQSLEENILDKINLRIIAFVKIYSAMTKAANLKTPEFKFLGHNPGPLARLQEVETLLLLNQPLITKSWELALKHYNNCNPKNLTLFNEIYTHAESKTIRFMGSNIRTLFNDRRTPENRKKIEALIDGADGNTRKGVIRDTLAAPRI